jgi:magnesium chelatase family protein
MSTVNVSTEGKGRFASRTAAAAGSDGVEKIGWLHLAEALSYRALAEDLRRAA